jgi:hypothetical protein
MGIRSCFTTGRQIWSAAINNRGKSIQLSHVLRPIEQVRVNLNVLASAIRSYFAIDFDFLLLLSDLG